MATVQVNLCTATARIEQQPVINDSIEAGETITSSGTSQPTTIAAGSPAGADEFWEITAVGGAVWVAFGSTPVADAGVNFLVADGQTRWWRATPGNKAAVIDA